LAKLPADLPMPAGARRRSLVAYQPFGQRQVKAEYLAAGTLDAVCGQMAGLLAEAGWRVVRPPGPRAPLGAATLRKSNDILSLHLQAEGDWVNIVAVITRIPPASPSGP